MTKQDVYAALVSNVEGRRGEPPVSGEWRDVYLDNARPGGVSPHAFAGFLSALERDGVYRPEDGFAWGRVLIPA
jgi:hypothetical protein